MDLLEELKALGVNTDEGLKRLMGNEKLYRRLLGSFVKMMKSNVVGTDFNASDYTTEQEKVHAVKGTAGNLSLTPIFEAYSQILDLMRSGQPEEARTVLEKVLPVQEKIIQCIESHME